jgi:hypothetical protein
VTLTNVKVKDEMTGDEWTIASLAPGKSETFTAKHKVTEADILAGSVINEATATADGPVPPVIDPDEEEDPTVDPEGHLVITKMTTSEPANGEAYDLSEEITYEIKAENTGNQTLTNVKVKDDLTGDEWTIASLAPGKSETFTATYEVTEADILAGSVINEATATADGPVPPVIDPDKEENPTEDPKGHLTISKTTTSSPNLARGYVLDEVIRYSITVLNDGNVTISDITVTDELTGDEWTIDALKPGESQTFAASYTVTQADVNAGSVVNVATATGTDPEEKEPEVEPGTKEDPTTTPDRPIIPPEEPEPPVYNGHLTLTKRTASTPANGTAYVEGERIFYLITVLNDGDAPLTGITVRDELTGDVWTIDSLEPGMSRVFNTTYTVTAADVEAGSVVNVATASGSDPNGDEPTVTPGRDTEPTGKNEPVPVPPTPLDPGTAWALLNLIATILTGGLSLGMLIKAFGKKKEEDDEEEGEKAERSLPEGEEGEDETKIKRHKLMKIASVVPAIAAVVTFILTEDMSADMALVDRWTILMAAYLVVNGILAIFSRKKKVEPEEEEAEENAEN